MTTAIYTFNGAKVRTLGTPDAPLFIAADVCQCLGLSDVTNATKGLSGDETTTVRVIDSIGRSQDAIAVTESGLYSLIFKSRKAQAKEFQRWVTSEVLPAIRKTGSYTPTRQPSSSIADMLDRAAAEIRAGSNLGVMLSAVMPKNEFGALSEKTGLPKTRLMPSYFTSRYNRDERTARYLEAKQRQLDFEADLAIIAEVEGSL
jgi:prophage antirepressor-like protein